MNRKQLILRSISRLLCYPSKELKENILQMKESLDFEEYFLQKKIDEFVQFIHESELLDLQEHYVTIFDRSPKRSLHLFEHVHGESRERGQAMVDLSTMYEEQDMCIEGTELPDYFPIFLEFLSIVDDERSTELLENISKIISALSIRVKKTESPYSVLFELLLFLAPPLQDPKEMQKIREEKELTNEQMDEAWVDGPVSFSGSSCPTATKE